MKKLLLISGIITTFYNSVNAQWVQQATGFADSLRGIHSIDIVSPSVAWAVAFDGIPPVDPVQEFTRTIDGGATWTAGKIISTSSQYNTSSISAIDANTAWVTMHDIINKVGAIFKTTDGGDTWVQVTNSAQHFQAPFGHANFIHFWDANTGVAMGDPTNLNPYNDWGFEVLVTSDGGTTWKHINPIGGDSIPFNLGAEFGLPDNFTVLGDKIWFGTSRGRVFRSSDKGLSWDASIAFDTLFHALPPSDSSSIAISGIAFRDSLNGIATGHLLKAPYTDKGMVQTNDGGVTWTPVANSLLAGDFTIKNDIAYVPGTAGAYIIVGSHDPAYSGVATDKPGSAYTLNNGLTWTNLDTIKHYGIDMYDLNTGWSGGFSSNDSTGGIFKWSNNGIIQAIAKHDMEKNNQFLIFPNPASTVLNIHLLQRDIDRGNLTLTDMLGRSVYQTQLTQVQNSISLNNIKSGVYLLNVATETGASTAKIIIQ